MKAVKVLLICGSAALTNAVRKFLISENKKNELFCFFDSNTALKRLSKEEVDLAIIDFQMANGQGAIFLEKVKKIKSKPRIIGISKYKSHEKKCLDSGCDGFLRRTFLPIDLKNEIEGVINLKTKKGKA